MKLSKSTLYGLGIMAAVAIFVVGFELGRSFWLHDLNDTAMSDQVFVQAALTFRNVQRLEAGSTDELRKALNRRLDSRLSMLTSVSNKERILESCFLARVAAFRQEYLYADQLGHVAKLLAQALPVDEACEPCEES